MSNVVKTNSSITVVDPQAQLIVQVLEEMGLPSENVIADQQERAIVGANLPGFIQGLPEEVRRDARYLSKFVVGAGMGLFDYSLNAVWNEVVLELRGKAVTYGLDIFYDSAVGGNARNFYQDEDDLAALKDSVLLDTCRKLELISDTTYRKLKHILDMRNSIGISHPTTYSINAFELMGWLQTCVQDVLQDRPTAEAIQVQAFISNLRQMQTPLDQATLTNVQGKISALPSHHCGSILRTVFGIYVAPNTSPQVRKNIALIAPTIWQSAVDQPKYQIGILLEGYNTNLHQAKYELGGQFLTEVRGNSYRTANERTILVDGLVDQLETKHNGWDNFHNEPPVVDQICSYVSEHSHILEHFSERLVRVVLMCRIGNGVSYCRGVSTKGVPYYDRLLSILGDKWAPHAMVALMHYEIQRKLTNQVCRENAKVALEKIKSGVVNQRLLESLDFLIAKIETTGKCVYESRFKQLTAGYINWN